MSYPEKPAPTDLPILPQIKRRWSPVIFSNKALTQEMIDTLFEAARWTASSFGEQPWRYVYATTDDGAERQVLESLLAEGNAWAKNAYLLGISFANPAFTRNNKPNRHHMHDTGAATSYMMLQAVELGLIGHQMAGFDVEKANEALGAPRELVPGSMFAIGYPGDPAAFTEEQRKRDASDRMRNPQHDFVFRGAWKKAA